MVPLVERRKILRAEEQKDRLKLLESIDQHLGRAVNLMHDYTARYTLDGLVHSAHHMLNTAKGAISTSVVLLKEITLDQPGPAERTRRERNITTARVRGERLAFNALDEPDEPPDEPNIPREVAEAIFPALNQDEGNREED